MIKFTVFFSSTIIVVCLVWLTDKALFWRTQLYELSALSSKTGKLATSQSKVLVVIGDSIVESFPVKSMLRQEYYIINYGVAGDNIRNIAQRYKKIAKDTFHDVLVVEGGINDIIYNMVDDNRTKEKIYNYIIDSYREIIITAKMNNIQPICMEILPVTSRFLLPYARLFYLPTGFGPKQVNVMVRKVNNGLSELCIKNSVPLIAAYDAIATRQGEADREYINADGYHVNIFGYKKIAAVINFKLVNLMAS